MKRMMCIIAVTVFLVYGSIPITTAGDHRRLDTPGAGQGTLKPSKGTTGQTAAVNRLATNKAKHVKSKGVPANKAKLGKLQRSPGRGIQQDNRQFNATSNVLKVKSDTEKADIKNIR